MVAKRPMGGLVPSVCSFFISLVEVRALPRSDSLVASQRLGGSRTREFPNAPMRLSLVFHFHFKVYCSLSRVSIEIQSIFFF